MRIKADLYSGHLFEYWEPKARPLDATGHQPSQYEDKHRDRSKHETQSYNDDERRHRDQNENLPISLIGSDAKSDRKRWSTASLISVQSMNQNGCRTVLTSWTSALYHLIPKRV